MILPAASTARSMPSQPPVEDHPRNRTCRTRLASAIGMNRRVPIHLAAFELQGLQAATSLLQRIVNSLPVRRAAPNHETRRRRRLRFPQLGAPKQLPICSRIERNRHAALARCHQHVFAVHGLENRRRAAEIVVRPQLFRAISVGRVRRFATVHERIAGELLVMPHQLAVFHPQRQDGIARRRGHTPKAVAGSDVNEFPFGVHGWRVPYRSARRAPHLLSVRVLANCTQRLGDTLHSPQHFARIGIERGDGAPRFTALVIQVRARQRLCTRHRHVEPAVIPCRTGAQIVEAVLYQRLPQQLAVVRIDRISRGGPGHEKNRIARARVPFDRRHNRREAPKQVSTEGPIDATGPGVHRINHPIIAAYKHTTKRHSGLRIHVRRRRQSESPLQLQLGYIWLLFIWPQRFMFVPRRVIHLARFRLLSLPARWCRQRAGFAEYRLPSSLSIARPPDWSLAAFTQWFWRPAVLCLLPCDNVLHPALNQGFEDAPQGRQC